MPRSLHGISQFAVPAVLLLLVLLTFAAPGKLGAGRSLPVQAEQTIAFSDRYRISVAESAPELLPGPARHRPGRPGLFRLPTGGSPPTSPVLANSETRCGPVDGSGTRLQLSDLGAWRSASIGRISLVYREGSTAERDLEAIGRVVASTLLLVEEVLETPPLARLSVIVHENMESIAQVTGTANLHFDGTNLHVVCGWPVNLTALAHEMTHAVSRLSYGLRAPALLAEGLAVWAAPRVLELALERSLPLWASTNGPDYYRSALSELTVPPSQSLLDTAAFGSSDPTLAYGTASLVVSHLLEAGGLEQFWALWAEGDGVEAAITEHYGLTWAELDAEYLAAAGLDRASQPISQRAVASACAGAAVRIGSALPAAGPLAEGPVGATARGSFDLPEGCLGAGELVLHLTWVYQRDGTHFLNAASRVLTQTGTFFVSASGSDTAGGVAVATFWALVLDGTVVATGE